MSHVACWSVLWLKQGLININIHVIQVGAKGKPNIQTLFDNYESDNSKQLKCMLFCLLCLDHYFAVFIEVKLTPVMRQYRV